MNGHQSPLNCFPVYFSAFSGYLITKIHIIREICGQLFLQNEPNPKSLKIPVSLYVTTSKASGLKPHPQKNEPNFHIPAYLYTCILTYLYSCIPVSFKQYLCSSVAKNGFTLDSFGAILDNFGTVWDNLCTTKNTQNPISSSKSDKLSKNKISKTLRTQKILCFGNRFGVRQNRQTAAWINCDRLHYKTDNSRQNSPNGPFSIKTALLKRLSGICAYLRAGGDCFAKILCFFTEKHKPLFLSDVFCYNTRGKLLLNNNCIKSFSEGLPCLRHERELG